MFGGHSRSLTCCAKSQELRACCRPTETGAGLSDARIAAAASHFTGVFLVCAWCREISRILDNPHRIRRRRDRLLCAPQARPAHTRHRATGARTLPACLSCVVMLCHQRHCRSTLQCCGIGRRENRVQTRRLRSPVHTACPIVVIGLLSLHCCPRFICRCPSRPQKQKLRGRSETS